MRSTITRGELEDQRISLQSRAVLAWLKTHASHFEPRVTYLQARLGITKGGWPKIREELLAFGVLKRDVEGRRRGGFSWDLKVIEQTARPTLPPKPTGVTGSIADLLSALAPEYGLTDDEIAILLAEIAGRERAAERGEVDPVRCIEAWLPKIIATLRARGPQALRYGYSAVRASTRRRREDAEREALRQRNRIAGSRCGESPVEQLVKGASSNDRKDVAAHLRGIVAADSPHLAALLRQAEKGLAEGRIIGGPIRPLIERAATAVLDRRSALA
ncbi:hypothetical protein OPU71_14210 [Niveibacterium sp. 24ML]|uniref:hypothetical protein n=1 Tax=Niveibacterium sp. 24ML TaxID=2985512 RepID=UPI002271A2BC|nr:hypothetical protein [Niveibacterium sp. 24ML]MCX9157280.1 hypothetical protein [Niveibacterium sp. 24ML]